MIYLNSQDWEAASSLEIEWCKTNVYTPAEEINTLAVYKVLKPQAGERYIAFSIHSMDFMEDAAHPFHEMLRLWDLEFRYAPEYEQAVSRLKEMGYEDPCPQSMFLQLLREQYAGYFRIEKETNGFSKEKIPMPKHIAAMIGVGDGSFINPLSTGDFSEVRGIAYSKLNITQYLGTLYLSPDYYKSGKYITIASENGVDIILQGVSPEARNNKLITNYRKKGNTKGDGFLGIIDLKTHIVTDLLEIPMACDYYTRLAWLDDHTIFAGAPLEPIGMFYSWLVFDLNEHKVIRYGDFHEDEPNMIIHDGKLWVEHWEVPQRVHPNECPRKTDPIQIRLLPDPENSSFANIQNGRVTLAIKNISDKKLRLLKPCSTMMDDSNISFIMEDHDYLLFPVPTTNTHFNWGVIPSASENGDDRPYIQLAPREEVEVDIEFFYAFATYDGEPLYLAASYVNMSGEDCVKGVFTSPTMRFDFRGKGCQDPDGDED